MIEKMSDQDPGQSSTTGDDDCNHRGRRQKKRHSQSSYRPPSKRGSVYPKTGSGDALSSILSIDKYIKYLGDKTNGTDESRFPTPHVLENHVNNDSQLTDQILTVNGETPSIPFIGSLLNVTGLLQELPLPAPLPADTGHPSLLSHLPCPEDTGWLLKIRDSVIIPKLVDCLCSTATQQFEMIDENDREQSHIGKTPILLKTLLERKPDIFKSPSKGLDKDSMTQYLIENEKSDSNPNNPSELPKNLHKVSSKEQNKNKFSRLRNRNNECSSHNLFEDDSNGSSSFIPEVSNSSSVNVESSVPVVTSRNASFVDQCQSMLNKKPLENSHSKIYAEESVRKILISLPNSTVSGSQPIKKTEIFNQHANKKNNFDEKRVSVKKCPDGLSIFYIEDKTVSETSVKQNLMKR